LSSPDAIMPMPGPPTRDYQESLAARGEVCKAGLGARQLRARADLAAPVEEVPHRLVVDLRGLGVVGVEDVAAT